MKALILVKPAETQLAEEQRGHTALVQSCMVLVSESLDRHCLIAAVDIERSGYQSGHEDRAGWRHEVPQMEQLVQVEEGCSYSHLARRRSKRRHHSSV